MLRPRLAALAAILLLLFLSPPAPAAAADAGYRVGVGIGDITGEAAEVGMLGYADPSQTTEGLASRQWARAFIVADPSGHRVAFVSTEVDYMVSPVQQEVLRRLAARHGTDYNDQNVVITATHTHSGPGGYGEDILYNLTTFGFRQATYDALVDGIVQAIENATPTSRPAR